MTRPKNDVEAVRDLLDQGFSIAETARRVGIARATVRDWMRKGFDETLVGRLNSTVDRGPCEFSQYVRDLSEPTYAYLLGLYLGDGHLTECLEVCATYAGSSWKPADAPASSAGG